MLKQSATDYVVLVQTIEGAFSDLVVIDPTVANRLMPRKASITSKVTTRQQEVLTMITQCYNKTAIAKKQVLATKPVEIYINAN